MITYLTFITGLLIGFSLGAAGVKPYIALPLISAYYLTSAYLLFKEGLL